jgi:hypothetical protein
MIGNGSPIMRAKDAVKESISGKRKRSIVTTLLFLMCAAAMAMFLCLQADVVLCASLLRSRGKYIGGLVTDYLVNN